jgi:hypothetical protein
VEIQLIAQDHSVSGSSNTAHEHSTILQSLPSPCCYLSDPCYGTEDLDFFFLSPKDTTQSCAKLPDLFFPSVVFEITYLPRGRLQIHFVALPIKG